MFCQKAPGVKGPPVFPMKSHAAPPMATLRTPYTPAAGAGDEPATHGFGHDHSTRLAFRALGSADDRMVDAPCEEKCQTIVIDSPHQRPNPKRLGIRWGKL
jgi:hypothetical protein